MISVPLLLAAIWALLATVVAVLPMRFQYAPGWCLLIAAPVLIIWIGAEHGWIFSALALAGLASMFRNPLMYYYKKARGQNPQVPKS
jgi:nicotinamide riboside transporter PnuC